MILFDGTYRLQRQENASRKTIGECACAWWVRIVDFSIDRPEVRYLRPYVIIATQTGEGIFRTTCAESLGNRIYRDFNLKMDETLWIEHYPHEPALCKGATRSFGPGRREVPGAYRDVGQPVIIP
ncbi:MAG: hypothetical protein R6U40_01235, partial [Desulfobacterales bacterium]